MASPGDHEPNLTDASKRLAQQALVVCENRIQLFLLEAQEEQERIFRAFWLSLALAVFILLAGIALTLLVVVACWQWSPVAALSMLVLVYGGMAGFIYAQLARLRRDWQSFSATFNELRKDRECLEKKLS
jgi:uncharacterized membrane protein YqjE